MENYTDDKSVITHTVEVHIPPKIKDTFSVRNNINQIRQLSEDYNIPIQEVAEIADSIGDYDIAKELRIELDNYYDCYY